MKKLLSIVLALVLVFALCAMPASAETNSSEWKRTSGPGKINFTDEGTKISLDQGVTFCHYQKQINIRDFTAKIKINAPTYDEEFYALMTIGGNGKYTDAGGAQSFILFWVRGDHVCVQAQILHRGFGGLKDQSHNFFLDLATEDITIHGKKITDTKYSLEFNGSDYWEFEVPENFNFVEDVNGQGCIGFGGSIGEKQATEHEVGAYNVIVKEINGVKMNGKDEPVSSDTSTGGTTGGTTGGSDTGSDSTLNPGIIGGDTTTDTTDTTTEEKDNTLLIVVIICGAVLLLAIAAIVVLLIVLKKKNATPVEEVEETVEEPTEE